MASVAFMPKTRYTNGMTLAQYFVKARERRHLSQRDVARLASIEASTLSRIEADKTSPRATTLRKLINALQLDDDEKTALTEALG